MMRVLSLFAGIGGFDLGLERTGGFKTVALCEIDPFCKKVLAKNWPGVPIYDDIRKLTAERLEADGIGVDVICGGFPCQDLSLAGKGAGLDGTRSGLWSELARLVGELRPKYLIVENVPALLGRGLGRILGELSQIGYDTEWHCIPACALNAPHRRDRVWIIAYPISDEIRNVEQRLSRRWPDGIPAEGQALAGDDGEEATLADADIIGAYGGGPRDGSGDVPDANGGGRQGEWLEECPRIPGACRDELDGLRAPRRRDGAMENTNGSGQPRLVWQDAAWEADAARRPGQNAAVASSQGLSIGQGSPGQRPYAATAGSDGWTVESGIRRVAFGLPARMDGNLDVWSAGEWPGVPRVVKGGKDRVNRLKALGNSVVPQIVMLIGYAILGSQR